MCISAGVLAAVSLASTAISTGTALKRASDAKKSAKLNARASERQAQVAEQQAQVAADQKRREVARLISSQKARFAASGVTLEGTPLEVLGDTQEQGELDIETLLWNGATRAEGYRSRAEIQRAGGRSEFISGIGEAGSTLLTGAYSTSVGFRRATGRHLFE